MLGQQTTPVVEVLPGRLMNGNEQALWDSSLALLDDLSDYVVLLKLLGINTAYTFWFAQQHGLQMASPAALESRVIDLEQKIDRVKELVRQVEDHNLSVQFVNGDINIVDPKPEFGALLLILGGALILAGLVGMLVYYKEEADDIRPKYNRILKATDKVFCTKGSPKTCAEWKQYKKEKGYVERKSLAQKIGDGIGKTAGTGAKWGLMIGIPLLALAFMWKNR